MRTGGEIGKNFLLVKISVYTVIILLTDNYQWLVNGMYHSCFVLSVLRSPVLLHTLTILYNIIDIIIHIIITYAWFSDNYFSNCY